MCFCDHQYKIALLVYIKMSRTSTQGWQIQAIWTSAQTPTPALCVTPALLQLQWEIQNPWHRYSMKAPSSCASQYWLPTVHHPTVPRPFSSVSNIKRNELCLYKDSATCPANTWLVINQLATSQICIHILLASDWWYVLLFSALCDWINIDCNCDIETGTTIKQLDI